jgi:uncharacterized BrkB/YihY/UPF0761 family membrane protein
MAKKAKSTNSKTNTVKKVAKRIYTEKHPENHKISGKFTGLYVMFAITTVLFAALSVYLLIFSADMLSKYESIDANCREGNCQVVKNNPDLTE